MPETRTLAGQRVTRRRSSIPSVYRPVQIRRGLERLPQLREAIRLGCSPEAEEERVGTIQHHQSDGIRAELVCFVADLNHAISLLPGKDGRGLCRRMRDACELYWGQGMVFEDIAPIIGCGITQCWHRVQEGERRIVRRLCR